MGAWGDEGVVFGFRVFEPYGSRDYSCFTEPLRFRGVLAVLERKCLTHRGKVGPGSSPVSGGRHPEGAKPERRQEVVHSVMGRGLGVASHCIGSAPDFSVK